MVLRREESEENLIKSGITCDVEAVTGTEGGSKTAASRAGHVISAVVNRPSQEHDMWSQSKC